MSPTPQILDLSTLSGTVSYYAMVRYAALHRTTPSLHCLNMRWCSLLLLHLRIAFSASPFVRRAAVQRPVQPLAKPARSHGLDRQNLPRARPLPDAAQRATSANAAAQERAPGEKNKMWHFHERCDFCACRGEPSRGLDFVRCCRLRLGAQQARR